METILIPPDLDRVAFLRSRPTVAQIQCLFGEKPDRVKRSRRLTYVAQAGICPLCGKAMIGALSDDHVTPKCRGGATVPGNLLLVHRTCNRAKGSRAPYPCEVMLAEIVGEMEVAARRHHVKWAPGIGKKAERARAA